MRLNPFNPCLVALIALGAMMTSCVNTKKAIYFNNIQDTVLQNVTSKPPVIQKNDLLGITISSLNPDASAIFNIQGGSASSGSSIATPGNATLSATGGLSVPTPTASQNVGYLVDQDDSVQLPVLGKLKAGGFTKEQLADEIRTRLDTTKLLTQPTVIVRFLNFRVTVLGEVARPSTINVSNERISILEALGLAGDLTIYGKRENVLLVREEGDKKVIRRLNLNSPDILTSPYYYLKTNDVVYVEPSRSKIASASRSQQLLPVILSALSLVAVIVSYYVRN